MFEVGFYLTDLREGGGDGSASNSLASLVVELDADRGLNSGGDSFNPDGEGDHVVSRGQGASSGNGIASLTAGQIEWDLGASGRDHGEDGKGGGLRLDVDSDQEGDDLAHGNVAGLGRAFGDGQADGSGLARARVELDVGREGGGHEGSGKDHVLEHGCWMWSVVGCGSTKLN